MNKVTEARKAAEANLITRREETAALRSQANTAKLLAETPTLMRLLGPFVVVLTVAVLGTGVALLFVPIGARHQWLFLHKASFVLWFGAMVLHVLGHLVDTARLAPGDWYRRTRADVRGAGIRQWTVVATIAIGVLLGLALVGRSGLWP